MKYLEPKKMRNTFNKNEIGSKHIDKKRKSKNSNTRKKNQIVNYLDVNNPDTVVFQKVKSLCQRAREEGRNSFQDGN